MTDKKKPAADEAALREKNEEHRRKHPKKLPKEVILTAGGEPLPIDPDTGEIDVDKLTDEQRQEIQRAAEKVSAAVKSAWDSDAFRQLQETIKRISRSLVTEETRETLQEIYNNLRLAQDLLKEIEELEDPYLNDELKKPEYGGATIDDLLRQYEIRDLQQLPENSLLYKALAAARTARNAALPVIDSYRTSAINTPVDRVNFLAWDDFKETGGQIRFNLMSDRDKRNPDKMQLDITARFSLSFADDPGITTTKELNHFDRRLQQAVDTIYTGGQDIILIGDLYFAMGGKTAKPSENQREKIIKSLQKQRTATVFIDNETEAKAYSYPHFEYEGAPLASERVRVKYAGREVEAIRVLNRPPLMRLADERNQMSAVPLKVLQSGISQTNNNLRIEDYLLYRIVRQKNTVSDLRGQQEKRYTQARQKEIQDARTLTIMLATFYEKTGTARKKAIERERALKTACRFLDHYAACGFIEEYKTDAERITILLPKK